MGEKILLAVALQRYVVIPPPALAVRDLAVDMAKAQHASLTVLTVHTPLEQMPEIESTGAKLNQFVAPLLDMGISVDSTVREGSPRVLIQEVAREIHAGLIIMGTHIKRGILDTPLGGTAQAVLKEAPCRILFVVPTVKESEETRRLIIPDYPYVFPYGL